MLSAIGISIYEHRKYLVLTLVVSMIAIPIANALVIQRDRNRNEMYGEAFWIFGFSVYDMNDTELATSPEMVGMGFNDGYHTLPAYLGGVKYEYPVFGLIFFAIATWLIPGTPPLQALWLNFLLVLVFNLNLALIAILLGDKIYKVHWARLFAGGYFIYGLLMSAGGGKLEPIVDCLMLMSFVLWKENQKGKAMFTLGLAVQTKVYPVVALPAFFLLSPVSIIWFLASGFLTVVPVFMGASFDSLVSHMLNLSSYSPYIVNPMYPGLTLGTPILNSPPNSYIWLPAAIPLIIYSFFMLATFRMFLPAKAQFFENSFNEKLKSLIPLYLYCFPFLLFFLFRWVMPWYLYWLAPVSLLFTKDEYSVAYMKQIALIGLLYLLGLVVNWPYFVSGPIPGFFENFPHSWNSIYGIILLGVLTAVAYFVWRWEFDRRERNAELIRAAEARGELII